MRRIAVIALIVMFAGCLVPVTAMAQAKAARQYKVDMKVDLDWVTRDPETGNDVDINEYTFTLNVGYFINEMFEVGPEIAYSKSEEDYNDGSPKDEMTRWELVAKGNFHFAQTDMVNPYAGVRLGFSSMDIGDADDTAFIYGAQVGFDYFITQNVSVNPELRYTMVTYTFYGIDFDVSDMSLMIGFGIHF